MSRPVRRAGLLAIQLVLTLTVSYFLFRSLRLSWQELAGIDWDRWTPRPVPLIGSLVALLCVFLYLVRLWASMVRALGGPGLRLTEAMAIFFIANLGRYVPGKVWQLAGLTYLAGRRGVSVPVASSAAVLGQVLSLGAAALVGVAFTAWSGTLNLGGESLPWALGLAGLILAVTVVPPALRAIVGLAFKVSGKAGSVPNIDPWFGGRWLALYLPAWIGYGLAFGALWAAFPALPAVSWGVATGAFAAGYFLGYAAIFAPAGVGVREGAMAVLLAPVVGAAQATVLAIMARLWMTSAELIPVVGLGLVGGLGKMRTYGDEDDTESDAV